MWDEDESMTKEKFPETQNACFVAFCPKWEADGRTDGKSEKSNAIIKTLFSLFKVRLDRARRTSLQDVDEELLAVKWKFG